MKVIATSFPLPNASAIALPAIPDANIQVQADYSLGWQAVLWWRRTLVSNREAKHLRSRTVAPSRCALPSPQFQTPQHDWECGLAKRFDTGPAEADPEAMAFACDLRFSCQSANRAWPASGRPRKPVPGRGLGLPPKFGFGRVPVRGDLPRNARSPGAGERGPQFLLVFLRSQPLIKPFPFRGASVKITV